MRNQLDALDAAQDRPGLREIALVLAADMDDDNAVPQRAALAHRLIEVLDLLGKGPTRRGRLSLVRKMTQP